MARAGPPLRLKEWLVAQVESGRYPGLRWEDGGRTLFRIPWKHAAKQDYRQQQDAALFKVGPAAAPPRPARGPPGPRRRLSRSLSLSRAPPPAAGLGRLQGQVPRGAGQGRPLRLEDAPALRAEQERRLPGGPRAEPPGPLRALQGLPRRLGGCARHGYGARARGGGGRALGEAAPRSRLFRRRLRRASAPRPGGPGA